MPKLLTCFALYPLLPWFSSQRKLKALIGNYTFLEAYERTGRILNVSVCPADTNEPARLLNYLTAPQVMATVAVGTLLTCCFGL
jgi:predicted acylesterase/phospholipase RssA